MSKIAKIIADAIEIIYKSNDSIEKAHFIGDILGRAIWGRPQIPLAMNLPTTSSVETPLPSMIKSKWGKILIVSDVVTKNGPLIVPGHAVIDLSNFDADTVKKSHDLRQLFKSGELVSAETEVASEKTRLIAQTVKQKKTSIVEPFPELEIADPLSTGTKNEEGLGEFKPSTADELRKMIDVKTGSFRIKGPSKTQKKKIEKALRKRFPLYKSTIFDKKA